ncbi:MAG: YqhA family protein [Microthrixaceae bacterium]
MGSDDAPPDVAPPHPAPQEHRRPSLVGRMMERARYVAAIPAVGMVLLSLGTVVWAVVKAVSVAGDVIADPSDLDVIADLLKVTDLFLIGIVFLIVGVGLWELFVEDIELPPGLSVRTLSDLKDKLIDTLVLVLGVSFVEQVLARPGWDGLLELAASIAVVTGVLVLFRVLKIQRSG